MAIILGKKPWAMEKKGFKQKAVVTLLLLLLLVGCAGKKEKGLKTVEGDPEVLYKQGLGFFNRQLYKLGLEKFEQIKSNFPDSPPFTVWAELKIADSHFLSKQYVEAASAYEEFKKIHPTHEEIVYVQFQIGMSYFSQMKTSDRDQTITKKALSNFEYLIANYPPNLFTEKAKDKVRICQKQLAEHEFHIGQFYYHNDKFQAAVSRFEGLLEKYPKWLDEDKTLLFLGKSYIGLNQEEKARETLTRLVNDYPRRPPAKEARKLLSQGLKDKKATRKAKAIDKKKTKGKTAEPETESLVLVRYDEEGRQPASLKDERGSETKKEEGRTEEGRTKAIPETQKIEAPPEVKREDELKIAPVPGDEPARSLPPPKVEPGPESKPGGEKEKRKASLPSLLAPALEKEKPRKEALGVPSPEAKVVDSSYPIDITSDSVETFTKDNLILFKGNVMARQKDMVIYADSLEAVIIEDGKGIEKVIADGRVKIQQGVRVASCQKAIFYNLDKKIVLTGDPKVWEGDNIVSGEEIIFDIEQNRVEVKGGASGRGKVRIIPQEEPEKKE
jgi:outer membrane protein assembly factor BamD